MNKVNKISLTQYNTTDKHLKMKKITFIIYSIGLVAICCFLVPFNVNYAYGDTHSFRWHTRLEHSSIFNTGDSLLTIRFLSYIIIWSVLCFTAYQIVRLFTIRGVNHNSILMEEGV